jgi:hypothetical protein
MTKADDGAEYDIPPDEMRKIQAKAEELQKQASILKQETKALTGEEEADDIIGSI